MTKLEFLDRINDILIGLNTAESDALGSLYDELMRDAGWHPASELPRKPANGIGKIIVITFDDEYGVNNYANGWNMDNIKRWCYPPEEEE